MENSLSTKTITDFTGEDLSRLAQFGKVYLFETVSSTQEIVKGLVSNKEPALVIALTQTRGRGRFHRDWYSARGGLYFSYLLFPEFAVKNKISQMTLLAALAFAQSLESMIGGKIGIRWPNDLIFSGKKVGGLLCETKGAGLIIGLGLNLGQSFFPASLSDATSLALETNQEYNGAKVLQSLLVSLTSLYREFIAGRFTEYLPEIKNRQTLINQRVRIELWLHRIEGTVIDLDDEGRLVLRTDSGRLITITAGKAHRVANV